MIIVQLSGGIGNQMFQYAVARHLAIKHKTSLKFDITKLINSGYRKFALSYFNINGKVAEQIDFLKVIPIRSFNQISSKIFGKKASNKLFYYPYEHYEKLFHRVLKDNSINRNTPLLYKKIAAERFFHFDTDVLNLPNNIILLGYWLNEKYFIEIKDTIKQEFSINKPLDKKNKEIADLISSKQSVSIHIRRGDYLQPNFSNIFTLLNLDFYHKCVKYLAERINNPHFFIFSNDPIWVKANFKIKYDTTYVDLNSEGDGYKDLHLMSLCKHNITANSSFSWWAAWLNKNKDKIILTPKIWYNMPNHNIQEMIPKSWIKIDDNA